MRWINIFLNIIFFKKVFRFLKTSKIILKIIFNFYLNFDRIQKILNHYFQKGFYDCSNYLSIYQLFY